MLSSDSVAQALAAFHLFPSISYNRKSEIWKSDRLYSHFFNEKITAKHIVFVYSLYECIKEIKASLRKKANNGIPLLENENEEYEFLRLRGSNYILMAAVSNSIEVFLNKAIPDRFSLNFKKTIPISKSQKKWLPIVEACISFNEQLRTPTESSLKNEGEIKQALATFKSLTVATKKSNSKIYEAFAKEIEI